MFDMLMGLAEKSYKSHLAVLHMRQRGDTEITCVIIVCIENIRPVGQFSNSPYCRAEWNVKFYKSIKCEKKNEQVENVISQHQEMQL